MLKCMNVLKTLSNIYDNGCKLLAMFAKWSILDAWEGFEYGPEMSNILGGYSMFFVTLSDWKVETTKRPKILMDICTWKFVYDASQEIVENSVHIFKKLRCGIFFQLDCIIFLTRNAGRDRNNLIKIDWNCSKLVSFLGDCLFTDIISNIGKSLICCIYLFAFDFW